jgi:hypothetical protein
LILFAGQVLNGLQRGVMLFPMAAGLTLSTPLWSIAIWESDPHDRNCIYQERRRYRSR